MFLRREFFPLTKINDISNFIYHKSLVISRLIILQGFCSKIKF